MATKHCPNCGKPVQPGSLFCPNCGTKLNGSSNSSSSSGNMAEKAAKAAEAERRAKEEERARKAEKKAEKKYKSQQRSEAFKNGVGNFFDFLYTFWESGGLYLTLSIILGLGAAGAGVGLIMTMKNPQMFKLFQILFWGSVGLFGLNLILFILSCVQASMESGPATAAAWIFAIPSIFMVVVTLISIKHIQVKKYYFDAEGGVYYALKDKGYVVYGSYNDKELVTIKANIDGVPVVRLGSKSFKENLKVKEVVFEAGAKITLGEEAFYGCSSLQAVTFNGGYYNSESHVFDACPFLNTINMDEAEFVTNFDSTVRYAFRSGSQIFTDSKTSVLNIKNSIYQRVANNFGTIIVEGTVFLDGPVMAEYGDKELENQNLVLKPGFTFANSTITALRGKNVFSPNYNPIPFARNIYIPRSVASIPAGFFGTDLTKSQYNGLQIYYEGTEAEWGNITVDNSAGNEVYFNNQYQIQYETTYNA